MCAYQFIYTTKLNQLTESEFVYGVPNLVFYFKFKCYNFPGFGLKRVQFFSNNLYKDIIFYILYVCLPVYIYNKTKPAYRIRIFLWCAKLGVLF